MYQKDTAPTVPPRDGLPPRMLWLLGAGLLVFIAAVIVMPHSSTPAPKAVTTYGNRDATYICRDFVTDRLRAPATASWAWLDDEKVTRAADGTFTVRSYVDAQNGFGANIRTRYTCVVRPPAPDGKTWHLVSLEM